MQSLTGVVKHYDWGSLNAIPELLGHPEDGTPWAEYWLGGHSASPAVVDSDGTPLNYWLHDHRTAISPDERAVFGGRLPFLLKVLAADEPLSLQAHPSRADAEAGFQSEDLSGIAIDDPARNFKDDWPKPEMIVALTPFEVLSGFREPEDILDLFYALGLDNDTIRPVFGPLRYREGTAALAEVFLDCLTLDGSRQPILDQVLAAAVKHTSDDGEVGRFARLVIMLDEYHPGDSSLLAALMLNHVDLAPGQALHNTAGVVHSYLHGTGIEIMANSDNVLRAGLTSKHVDHAVLVSIVDFHPTRPEVLTPEADGAAAWHYPTSDPEFTLWRLEPTQGVGQVPLPGAGRTRLVLVTDGQLQLTLEQGDQLDLKQGQAALIGADEEPTMMGDAIAFLAAPGL